MCLDLKFDAARQTASENIICYKRLSYNYILDDYPNIFKNYNGCKFTGIINDIKCEGCIEVVGGSIYCCTDVLELNNTLYFNSLGYNCSWRFDRLVQSIIINGIDIINEFYSNNHMFVTPYKKAIVQIGKLYNSKLIRIHDSNVVNIDIHSFANYEDAINDGSGFIIKCVIPKGAKYYEGLFGEDLSYASNKIKYVEIIKK